jgi:hypothetical protein
MNEENFDWKSKNRLLLLFAVNNASESAGSGSGTRKQTNDNGVPPKKLVPLRQFQNHQYRQQNNSAILIQKQRQQQSKPNTDTHALLDRIYDQEATTATRNSSYTCPWYEHLYLTTRTYSLLSRSPTVL